MVTKSEMHLKNAPVVRFEKRIIGSAGMAGGESFSDPQQVAGRKLAPKLLQERLTLTRNEIAPRRRNSIFKSATRQIIVFCSRASQRSVVQTRQKPVSHVSKVVGLASVDFPGYPATSRG
jgi:hypothetical protein